MKMRLLLVSIVTAGMILGSCGGGQEPAAGNAGQASDTVAADPYAGLPADIQAMMPKGKEIYDTKCFACHQKDGKGVPNTFPPVAGSDYLLADKVRAVAQTLNGSHEEMTVNGVVYNQAMPQQVNTKEDAVAVINYVLNNFGNNGGFVTLEEVKDVVIDPRKQ